MLPAGKDIIKFMELSKKTMLQRKASGSLTKDLFHHFVRPSLLVSYFYAPDASFAWKPSSLKRMTKVASRWPSLRWWLKLLWSL